MSQSQGPSDQNEPGPRRRVSVRCLIARVARLDPFHWALLRALQLFPAGARPGLPVLAARMRVMETAFLEDAWADLCEWHLVDDREFAQARPTAKAVDSLGDGWVALSEVGERTVEIELDAASVRRRGPIDVALLHTAAWAPPLLCDERILKATPVWPSEPGHQGSEAARGK